MTDRASTIVLGGRAFAIIIAADDRHDWSLADPSEQPEFDRLWNQMANRLDIQWHIRQAVRARVEAQSDPTRRRDISAHLLAAVRLRRGLRERPAMEAA
jgi:Spy/CpxP family protein refolding chaperone